MRATGAARRFRPRVRRLRQWLRGSPQDRAASQRPAHTDPIDDAGPLHRILEGTIIDAVLTNRLDGGAAAPVNCLVTNAVYSHSGQQVVIPAGARLLGKRNPFRRSARRDSPWHSIACCCRMEAATAWTSTPAPIRLATRV